MITNYDLKRVALFCIQTSFCEKVFSSFAYKFGPRKIG